MLEHLEGQSGAKTTVRVSELFERLLRYRNQNIGHGAPGAHSEAFYEKLGRSLSAGLGDLLNRWDVLAGRRLLYVADVRRQASGSWLVEQYELVGETARRLESQELPESSASELPRPERVYLQRQGSEERQHGLSALLSLHPLVTYDAETCEVYFLNGRRGRQKADYLCYTSGASRRTELQRDQRELLRRVFGGSIDDDALEAWAARSAADDAPTAPAEPSEAVSRTIGEFELISRIGQGGMGVVYRAWQPALGVQAARRHTRT